MKSNKTNRVIIKLIIPIVGIVLLVLFMYYRTHNYKGWQTGGIEDCGTIMIPGEWSYFEEDGKSIY